MPVDILLIDARWDVTTSYLHDFREHFLHSDLRHHNFNHLSASHAVQPAIDNYLKSNRIRYISGAGHGQYDVFGGYLNSVIWTPGASLSNVRGAIVHLLSCKTGRTLGLEMIQQGARAFWGYSEDFNFVRKKFPPTPVYTDGSAGEAILMDCIIDRGILAGLDADVIYDQVHDYFKQATAGLPVSSARRAVMLHNLNHLVCPALYYGRRTTTI